MLTRHSVTAESSRVETVPLNFLSTEDGRTVLAVTERPDDLLEIVAAPLTFVAHAGPTASLVDVTNFTGNLILHSPVLRINLEDASADSSSLVPRDYQAPDDIGQTKSQPDPEPNHGTVESGEIRETEDRPDAGEETEEAGVGRSETGGPGRRKKNALRGPDRFGCDLCHREFAKQALYRKHMESHAEEKPHRCPKCSASFNVPANFTLHMATHSTGEPKCPECGRKFSRMASLKAHMSLHEKEENLFCTECEDAFSTKAQLDAHLKLHGEKWIGEEARKCKLCDKRFAQPALYRLHIREHYKLQTKIARQTKTGTKHKTLYKCTICLKSFQKPSQLTRHIRVHTGEKPFKCTVCGRAFTQKNSLQIHTWQHNGIRPHACHLCNAKFGQKGNLNAHITRVHSVPEGEPIYGCSYCSCVFKKLGSLNGHMKRAHSDADDAGDAGDADDAAATVNSVINQLASLDSSAAGERAKPDGSCESRAGTKSGDILQQALKNSGLPSKNGTAPEGVGESKRAEARTSLVTLLDRAADAGASKYLTIKQRCVGNARWYECNFCQKEFKKPSDLIRHLRVHTQEKPFKCPHCYRSFALKSTMIAHERTHSSTKNRHACGSCEKTFACHGSLIAHTRLHAKPSEPVSRPRNRTRNESAGAEEPIGRVVLQEPLVISEAGNEIRVARLASREKRPSASALDPARPHKCWVCQAAFRKISHLKQHHRRHTGERPYECTKCERRFASNSVLKSHLHTHEDSRPYGCSVCGAKFSTRSSMKRHLVTHSTRRPFVCPYCRKTFKTYVNCRKHTKIHKHEVAQRQLEQEKAKTAEDARDALACPAGPTVSALYSDSPGSLEISFQAQIPPDFSQSFEAVSEMTAASLGASPILHPDEAASVTLPIYTGEQVFIPESIREIEESLNQQLFDIGMNLNLGIGSARHPADKVSPEQQHHHRRNGAAEGDRDGGGAFSSQLDSFEMGHIGLQPDTEIDIELEAVDSASMASILPGPRRSDGPGERGGGIQAIVYVSSEHFSRKEVGTSCSETPDAGRASMDPGLLTEDFRGAAASFDPVSTGGPETTKASDENGSRGESLPRCHACGLKEHSAKHRGTREHECGDCGARFGATADPARPSKVPGAKRSTEGPSGERDFGDGAQLRSPVKLQEGTMWASGSPLDGCSEVAILPPEGGSISNGTLRLGIVAEAEADADADVDAAAVSQKVLLDAVAEREGTDRAQSAAMGGKERKVYTNGCEYCPKTFRKPSDLVRHVRTHTGERPYKCEYCGKSFAVKCTLDSHRKVHGGKKTFRCHVCSSLFATKGSLKVHMRLHTGSKPFGCPICGSRFRTSGHRKVHLLKHARECKDDPRRRQKRSKVAAVAEAAARLANLGKRGASEEEASAGAGDGGEGGEVGRRGSRGQRLREEETSEERIGADATGSGLAGQLDFQAEEIAATDAAGAMVSVNENGQLVTNLHFLLTDGLVTIRTEESLVAPRGCASIDPAPPRPAVGSSVAAYPPGGGGGGSDATRSGEVAKTSSRGGSKQCDVCGKTFTKPYQVERHKRVHTGERPYKCDLCAKSFAQKSTLQMHQKHHTGDRPYACPYCEYSFTQKGNLRTHVKRVHQLDTADAKRRRRGSPRAPVAGLSVRENAIEASGLTLDDASFVELLE